MLDYTLRRLLLLIPTLILGSVVLFVSMRTLPPRDAVEIQIGNEVLAEQPSLTYPISALWPQTPHLPLKTRVAVDALLAKLPARLAVVESRPKRKGDRFI